MSGYVYNGTQRDVEPAPEPSGPVSAPRKGKPGPLPGWRGFDPSKSGEPRGYRQHLRYGQEAYDACKAANATDQRDRRAARQVPRAERPAGVFDPAFCGTHKGYNRHQRHNTTPCVPCRAGHNEHQRTYNANRKAAA